MNILKKFRKAKNIFSKTIAVTTATFIFAMPCFSAGNQNSLSDKEIKTLTNNNTYIILPSDKITEIAKNNFNALCKSTLSLQEITKRTTDLSMPQIISIFKEMAEKQKINQETQAIVQEKLKTNTLLRTSIAFSAQNRYVTTNIQNTNIFLMLFPHPFDPLQANKDDAESLANTVKMPSIAETMDSSLKNRELNWALRHELAHIGDNRIPDESLSLSSTKTSFSKDTIRSFESHADRETAKSLIRQKEYKTLREMFCSRLLYQITQPKDHFIYIGAYEVEKIASQNNLPEYNKDSMSTKRVLDAYNTLSDSLDMVANEVPELQNVKYRYKVNMQFTVQALRITLEENMIPTKDARRIAKDTIKAFNYFKFHGNLEPEKSITRIQHPNFML